MNNTEHLILIHCFMHICTSALLKIVEKHEESTITTIKPKISIYGHNGRIWDCKYFLYRSHACIATGINEKIMK